MGNIEERPHRNQWGYFLNNRGVLKIQRVSHFGRMYIQHFQAWNICPSDYCEGTWGGRMSSQPNEPPQLVLLFWGTPLLKQPFPVWQSAKNHRKAGIFIDTPSVRPVETNETQLIRVFVVHGVHINWCVCQLSWANWRLAPSLPTSPWQPTAKLPNRTGAKLGICLGENVPLIMSLTANASQKTDLSKRIVSQLSSFRGVWKRLC